MVALPTTKLVLTDDISGPTSRRLTTLWDRLFAPVRIDLLVYFRLMFGGIMLYWVVKNCLGGFVEAFYIQPRVHFHYFGFGWVHPWPGDWMHVHFCLMGVCAALIALGGFYRMAAALFAVGFTYVFLIDKCLYQNHYYLVCLVSWLMPLLPAHRAFSLDILRRPALRSPTAPAWALWLVRFQIALPYFFGGVAKLNPDWLAGEPMRMMLAERTWYPGIGQFFTDEWCVQVFVWGGLLFDLLVVPALLWPRTRLVAYGFAFVFHVLNATLFTIGIFPWFMLLGTAVFFPPGSLRKLLRQPATAESPQLRGLTWQKLSVTRKSLAVFLVAYAAIQILLPLRHLFTEGNPSWTEEGHYFSWHMLLRGKQPAVRFYATDSRDGRTGAIDLRRYVTAHQMRRFARDPRMIHELSHYIADDLRSLGFPQVEVRVLALVSMNGRKPQLLIDPTVNLAAAPRTWRQPNWIVPLTEPLRETPWDVPMLEWEQHVPIPAPYRWPRKDRQDSPSSGNSDTSSDPNSIAHEKLHLSSLTPPGNAVKKFVVRSSAFRRAADENVPAECRTVVSTVLNNWDNCSTLGRFSTAARLRRRCGQEGRLKAGLRTTYAG